MTPEGAIKKSILDWLRRQPKCYARTVQIGIIPGRPNNASKGISDIICVWGGMFVAIEVKAPGKNPTPEQMKFLDGVNSAGGWGFVARSLADVIGTLRPRELKR